MMPRLEIDASRITDPTTFHDLFDQVFGFPEYYGRNMDAWIDCMTYLRHPDAGMTAWHVARDKQLVLVIKGSAAFQQRCPDLYQSFLDCADFVNERMAAAGELDLFLIELR